MVSQTRALCVCGWCVAVLTSLATLAAAQTRATGADVHGIITDVSGGRLPGVVVIARHLDINIARSAVTDDTGFYRIAALDPGDYEVTAILAGFVAEPRTRIRLQVGDAPDVSFEMKPQGIEESVEVTASAPGVQSARTSVSTVIAEREVEQLPLNGRRFIDLAALAAGVTTAGTADPAAETSGLSVIGQRPVSNNLLVDGLDNNDRVLGGATASFAQESIREFQVLTASYPAEFGNATGGVVNIVTRSGSNTTRGTSFFNYRDRHLNARGYFERFDLFDAALEQPKAPFRLRQFGAALGGPMRRDRTFFFTTVERGTIASSNVVVIDAGVAAILGAAGFPVERGDVAYDSNLSQAVARSDHYWQPASHLTLRLQWSDALNGNYAPFGGLVARSRGAEVSRRDWGLAAAQSDVLRGQWVHEARVQIVHQSHEVTPNDPVGPGVLLVGVASVGRSDLYPTDRSNWTLHLKDTVTRASARHTGKAGVELIRINQQASLSYAFGGSYVFAELPAIPGLLPTSLNAVESFAAGVPALYVQGYGDGRSPFTYTEASAFAQDDWRIGERLVIKGGVRYQQQRFPEFQVTVSDVGGGTFSYRYPLSRHHLSPRLAVAVDPSKGGRTSLHAAYGLFFGEQLTSVYGLTTLFGASDGTRLNVYPVPLSAAAWQTPGRMLPEGAIPAPSVTMTVAADVQTPRLHQASAGLSHDVGAGITVLIDGIFARGLHQLGALDYNPLVPSLGPGRRPNDVAGVAGTSATTLQYTDFGETWYKGLLVTTQRSRPSHDLRVAYTWSSTEDNSSRFIGLVDDNGRGRDPAHPSGLPIGFDPNREKGPADTDQRHRLVTSGSYRGPARLHIAGILSAASGVPFTPLAGADLNGDGIPDADRARRDRLELAAAVGRNSERLPSHVTLDLRVSRAFRLRGSATVLPTIDVFNLFNRTNFTEVNTVFGSGSYPDEPQRDAQGRTAYGRFAKSLAPRQIQLAARVSF